MVLEEAQIPLTLSSLPPRIQAMPKKEQDPKSEPPGGVSFDAQYTGFAIRYRDLRSGHEFIVLAPSKEALVEVLTGLGEPVDLQHCAAVKLSLCDPAPTPKPGPKPRRRANKDGARPEPEHDEPLG